MPSLLLVAHGSRVIEAAQVESDLVEAVSSRWDGPVHFGHLEIADPLAMDVAVALPAAEDEVVVQPLLLLPGNHATFDVQAVAAAAATGGRVVRVGQALGSDVRLLDVAQANVAAMLPADAVLVIASGTASDGALRSLDASAALVASGTGVVNLAAAPATLDGLAASEALARLVAEGATRVVVLPWMLFPGRLELSTTHVLANRAASLGIELVVADRFGAADGVVEAVVRRAQKARPFR